MEKAPGLFFGLRTPDQQIFVLLDCNKLTDLSSGCDFLALRLNFESRELRVESDLADGRESQVVPKNMGFLLGGVLSIVLFFNSFLVFS